MEILNYKTSRKTGKYASCIPKSHCESFPALKNKNAKTCGENENKGRETNLPGNNLNNHQFTMEALSLELKPSLLYKIGCSTPQKHHRPLELAIPDVGERRYVLMKTGSQRRNVQPPRVAAKQRLNPLNPSTTQPSPLPSPVPLHQIRQQEGPETLIVYDARQLQVGAHPRRRHRDVLREVHVPHDGEQRGQRPHVRAGAHGGNVADYQLFHHVRLEFHVVT